MRGVAAVVFAMLLVAGCSGRSAPPPPSTSASPGLPYDGELISAAESFHVLKARPSRGTLVIDPGLALRENTGFELSMAIISGDGGWHTYSFKAEPEDLRPFMWYNFTYPEAPPPFFVQATGALGQVWLARDLSVPSEHSKFDMVAKETRRIKVQYPPLDSPGSSAAGQPLKATTVFEFNATTTFWSGLLGAPSFHGTGTWNMPDGREVWHVDADGSSFTGGHLSNGSRPLQPGPWKLTLKGTGAFEIRLDLVSVRPSAWEHFGIQTPH